MNWKTKNGHLTKSENAWLHSLCFFLSLFFSRIRSPFILCRHFRSSFMINLARFHRTGIKFNLGARYSVRTLLQRSNRETIEEKKVSHNTKRQFTLCSLIKKKGRKIERESIQVRCLDISSSFCGTLWHTVSMHAFKFPSLVSFSLSLMFCYFYRHKAQISHSLTFNYIIPYSRSISQYEFKCHFCRWNECRLAIKIVGP